MTVQVPVPVPAPACMYTCTCKWRTCLSSKRGFRSQFILQVSAFPFAIRPLSDYENFVIHLQFSRTILCIPSDLQSPMTPIVKSLPQDKAKIVFHSAMMAVQNFGFMILYHDIWGSTPGPIPTIAANGTIMSTTDVCSSTRYTPQSYACLFAFTTCLTVVFVLFSFHFFIPFHLSAGTPSG